jgi:uracil-DNA glycosylase
MRSNAGNLPPPIRMAVRRLRRPRGPKPTFVAADTPPEQVPDGAAPEPADDSLAALAAAARGCRRCPLWKPATQTVFGEGPANARVLVVGEQPGDQEDLSGRPFVGPAGRLFDRALAELGVPRKALYVTNAVKHFKFERRGKVRLHRSPDPSEQAACRVWLQGELARVKPEAVVCLGAIAARNVFGSRFRLMAQRGVWQTLPDGTRAFATVHPSWVLRQRDDAERRDAYAHFVEDLSLLLDVVPRRRAR